MWTISAGSSGTARCSLFDWLLATATALIAQVDAL
jgi:hypothetical protein